MEKRGEERGKFLCTLGKNMILEKGGGAKISIIWLIFTPALGYSDIKFLKF